jgi:hypothetical protein
MSADGEFKDCFKSFPIPVRDGVVVSDVLRILPSTGITRYILVYGDGKRLRPRLIAVNA